MDYCIIGANERAVYALQHSDLDNNFDEGILRMSIYALHYHTLTILCKDVFASVLPLYVQLCSQQELIHAPFSDETGAAGYREEPPLHDPKRRIPAQTELGTEFYVRSKLCAENC